VQARVAFLHTHTRTRMGVGKGGRLWLGTPPPHFLQRGLGGLGPRHCCIAS